MRSSIIHGMQVRTRNAPSPTGIPHIGNTRTALFDYLLAKKYGGQFILRVEDTDQKRLVPGSVEKIYEIHDFLGLVPDEDSRKGGKYGPYVQTERLEHYQKYAKELIAKGAAYESEGAVRIKVPESGYSVWSDLIQGKISIPYQEVDDKVLLKSNGIPTYHLAVVVDDHLMEISHVLRGVEWISSTPVHLLLYQALGWKPPIFAHVPLLLGPDKSKLSKRHGAKSVLEYRDDGYLPEAINNFLFYLGFSYRDNSDILTLEEMVKIFDETKIQKQNAIFDLKKLDYFNKAWIKKLDVKELTNRLETRYKDSPEVKKNWLTRPQLERFLVMVRERITTLKDALSFMKQITVGNETDPVAASGLAQAEYEHFASLASTSLEQISIKQWQEKSLEEKLRADVSAEVPAGPYFSAIRGAVTGSKVSPPLFGTLELVGREETLKRLKRKK